MQIKQIMDLEESDILDLVASKAVSYTPEWKFTTENPDPGSAIAMAYASMMERTIRQFRHFPEKNRICFFNQLGASLRPAAPAEGYVRFFLAGEQTEGQQIEKDTMLYAKAGDEEIPFKVKNDVFVTPAQIKAVYEVCDDKDFISCLYRQDDSEENELSELPLFWGKAENLQEHCMYLSHSSMFQMNSEGEIELSFLFNEQYSISEEMLQCFADPEIVEIFYSNAEEGFLPFSGVLVDSGKLLLSRRKDLPPFEKLLFSECDAEKEQYYLKFKVKDFKKCSDFSMKKTTLSMRASYVPPESIQCNEEECSQIEYLPFGEKMGIYNAVYFGSTEVLGKKGATIRLSFHMDFTKIPISEEEAPETEWKWIMKTSDLQPDVEYDVMLTEVIWEYYNGKGWARLFPGKEYANIFHAGNPNYGRNQTIEFICPDDMEAVTIQSSEACYIRARAVKLTNLYKTRGHYLSPVLSDTYFHYDYKGNLQAPEHIYRKNNLNMQCFSEKEWKEAVNLRPFEQTGDEKGAVYFAFDCMPQGGPVRILMEPDLDARRQKKELLWEYYSRHGWSDLNAADETEQLSRAGMLIFMSPPDVKKQTIFDTDAFWIRVVDKKDSYLYRERETMRPPLLKKLLLNVTDAMNASGVRTEYFGLEAHEISPVFYLQQKKILEIKVYVDETKQISETELLELKNTGKAEIVYNEAGDVATVWVLWEQAEDFAMADARSRVYCLDRNEGAVSFGNGIQGKIPPVSGMENIRISYRTGGGSQSNVPAGAIERMELVHGYISRVENPLPMTGGSDRESTEHALKRLSAALRHQNRAVTAYDYECLAMQAMDSIYKVKCFTGRTEDGAERNGAMTLVVCMEDYRHTGNRFPEIREQIKKYLWDKMSLNMLSEKRFFIIPPVLAEFDIRMSVITNEYNQVYRIKNEIVKVLEQFLDPLTGNFDRKGYQIGTLPNHIQIRNAVNRIHGIRAIRDIFITVRVDGEEIELSSYPKAAFVLPVSGNHEISLQVET